MQDTVDNSNLLRLTPLFPRYPEVQFTMPHGRYPYNAAAGELAKKFPTSARTSSGCRRSALRPHGALGEWLGLVRMNKLTWGGDYRHVENSYSAVLLLRGLLFEVLGDKLDSDRMDLDIAKEIVRRSMFDNVMQIYSL